MNEAYINCPNCGAPANGCKCAYCGTPLRLQSVQDEPHQITVNLYADDVVIDSFVQDL